MDKVECLRINLSTERPVELMDFLSSCLALANEYNSFAEGRGGGKLLIKEVRHGSIEIDLVDIATVAAAGQMVMPFIENTNLVAEFFEHIKGVYSWVRNSVFPSEKPEYSPRTLKNVQEVLTPVAKDNRAQIVIAPVINGTMSAPLTINCNDSNILQNKLEYAIKAISEPKVERIEKCLLRWYQSRNVADDSSGDKVIIEELSSKPIRAEFKDHSVKALFLAGKENFFKLNYIADVGIKRIQGNPKLVIIDSIEPLGDIEDSTTDDKLKME